MLPILTDDDLTRFGKPILQSVAITEPELLRMTLINAREYDVPVEYLKRWYEKGPHEVVPAKQTLSAAIIRDGDLVRAELPDGSVYFVAWDVILMACEPEYVHFGGFTDYSKRVTKEWFEASGL